MEKIYTPSEEDKRWIEAVWKVDLSDGEEAAIGDLEGFYSEYDEGDLIFTTEDESQIEVFAALVKEKFGITLT